GLGDPPKQALLVAAGLFPSRFVDLAGSIGLPSPQELFLRVVPHECLGSLWSQRDKKGHEGDCPTVRATVAQFNLVAKAVVSSCLGDTGLRAAQRARLLEKWIRVAEECLCLRDFSSLYAVVSALHSTPLHRTVTKQPLGGGGGGSAAVPPAGWARGALVRSGPGAPVPLTPPRFPSPPQGVVPYLGTFLKDLVMLDTATRNRLQVRRGAGAAPPGQAWGSRAAACSGFSGPIRLPRWLQNRAVEQHGGRDELEGAVLPSESSSPPYFSF
uniref:Ras-GEF domain-containing protein n=1 Tax=Varanus komodoensis TaxID=61221 RepID=A0A8D2IUT5_VARKO